MSDDSTTIQISIETYKRLSGRKNPGDSFDDVISRVLDRQEALQKTPKPDENGDSDDLRQTDDQDQTTQNPVDEGSEDDDESGPEFLIEGEDSQQTALSTTNRLEEDVEQAILGLDLSTKASREQWIPAVREAYGYLEENKEASKQDFLDEIYPKESSGYSNEETWWRKVIRPSLKALPRVSKPKAGGKWGFTEGTDRN